MSVWKKRIEFRSRIGHVAVASVVGCIVQFAGIAALDEIAALEGTISYFVSCWMIVPFVAVTCIVISVPMYVAMFVSWRLRPLERRPTRWQYVALAIASMIGGAGQFSLIVFALPWYRVGVQGALSFLLWFCTWLVSVPLAMWVLRLLRPHGPGPVLRWKRRRRMHAGECLVCGYNLTRNESGTCSECGEPIWQSPSHP